MPYLAGLLGEYVFAFVHAFMVKLISSNADTPRGAAIDADLRMN
jgi:hypothetical protein